MALVTQHIFDTLMKISHYFWKVMSLPLSNLLERNHFSIIVEGCEKSKLI